jgi:hypothetical protein
VLRVPHRREQLADDDRRALGGRLGAALVDARLHGLDRLGERQATLQVLLGRPPQLGVDDTVGGQVQHRLAGHAGEVLRTLHDRDRVLERLQVPRQRSGAGGVGEPHPQLVRRGGQRVPDLLRDLGDGRRADATVEVLVERHLRGAADLVGGQAHAHIVARPRERPTAAGAGGRLTPDRPVTTVTVIDNSVIDNTL